MLNNVPDLVTRIFRTYLLFHELLHPFHASMHSSDAGSVLCKVTLPMHALHASFGCKACKAMGRLQSYLLRSLRSITFGYGAIAGRLQSMGSCISLLLRNDRRGVSKNQITK